MEFNYDEVKTGFTSPDYLFNFEPGGSIAPKVPQQPAPNSIENLAAEYLNKQRNVSDAVQNLHKIDNIYERVMHEAPSRNVEVLPPEGFDPTRPRIKNITPVEQREEIANLLERQIKRPASAVPPINVGNTVRPIDPKIPFTSATPRSSIGVNPLVDAKPTSLPYPLVTS